MNTFKSFPLIAPIQQALEALQFTTPTEIQQKTLAALLSTQKKVDFHGQAQTGTGKTLAFGIPLIQTIDVGIKHPQALIVAPTRELVLQICDSLKAIAQFMPITIEPIYGGMSLERQMRALRQGVHIVVGTPGRLNDHLRRKTLSLKNLRTLVLDEADIMLDMGFKEEVDEILRFAPSDRQIWLFSATVKSGIQDLKQSHMKDPMCVRVGNSTVTTNAMTKQHYCVAPRKHKIEALMRFIDSDPEFYGMIFCKTKLQTTEVADELSKRNYQVNVLHGDMDQPLRNKVIKGFKEKTFSILVATDVAARGIDVSDLTHVINYSLPEDQESYVHRIGRTGRAGKQGIAITFIERSEMRRLQHLMNRFKATITPIEVPSGAAVAQARLAQVVQKIQLLCGTQPANNEIAKSLRTSLEQRSAAELLNGLQNLIYQTELKHYGEYNDAQFTQPAAGTQSTHYAEGDQQEIMLHIGAQDGINKGDVLHYLAKSNAVKSREIGRIRVIKTRTFIMVPARSASAVMAALKGTTIRGKKVRVSFA